MDLGDFASLMKVVSPTLGEMDVAHLFMQVVLFFMYARIPDSHARSIIHARSQITACK